MRWQFILLILLFLLEPVHLSCKELLPKQFEAKVISIADGDTFGVLYQGKELKIRLEHIDCPERGQPFGKNAKAYISNLCFGKNILVMNKGKFDRYGRLLAVCVVNGIEVNKNMVQNGWAWHFKKYSDNSMYDKLEREARKRGVGLWQQASPIAPWAWRKGER